VSILNFDVILRCETEKQKHFNWWYGGMVSPLSAAACLFIASVI
jgi:hypothetical protein